MLIDHSPSPDCAERRKEEVWDHRRRSPRQRRPARMPPRHPHLPTRHRTRTATRRAARARAGERVRGCGSTLPSTPGRGGGGGGGRGRRTRPARAPREEEEGKEMARDKLHAAGSPAGPAHIPCRWARRPGAQAEAPTGKVARGARGQRRARRAADRRLAARLTFSLPPSAVGAPDGDARAHGGTPNPPGSSAASPNEQTRWLSSTRVPTSAV
ncbi:hypothetical protein GQ55_8G032600 [Panicum hallii var. hallii]|uniref:Uncharacterized protein n=1 Tax=Panicum hallii var. hallii TaxID=1504633 RepID=A0A2T7CK72_9POAL|nr:hypothetical protein GQ55_8G032600 [Panicum hallii var. hallii]